jgi:hypothetical protein
MIALTAKNRNIIGYISKGKCLNYGRRLRCGKYIIINEGTHNIGLQGSIRYREGYLRKGIPR